MKGVIQEVPRLMRMLSGHMWELATIQPKDSFSQEQCASEYSQGPPLLSGSELNRNPACGILKALNSKP